MAHGAGEEAAVEDPVIFFTSKKESVERERERERGLKGETLEFRRKVQKAPFLRQLSSLLSSSSSSIATDQTHQEGTQ